MSFPNAAVLDAFNRADENPLTGGGNWVAFGTTFYGAGNVLKLTSNTVTAATSSTSASAYNTNYGPDCEAYITLTTLPADGHYTLLWLRATNTADPSGYRVGYIYNQGGTDIISIQRCDTGSVTVLKNVSQDYAAGDRFGATVVGTVITVYRNTTAVASYDTVDDAANYSGAGLFVVNCSDQTQRLDNFGGGVSPPFNASAPVVAGLPYVGEVLVAGSGSWSGTTVTFTYQWQRDNTGGGTYSNIASATTATHTLVTADLNCNLRVVVTATSAAGTATANSNTVGPVTAAPAAPAGPSARVPPTEGATPEVWRQLVPGAAVFVGAQLDGSAAYYNGNTYVGYIDGNGGIRVAKVNKATGTITISPAITTLTVDQHSTPGILVRQSDHKIVVVVADVAVTSGAHIYRAISTNAEDVTAWGAAGDISTSLDGVAVSNYTYVNMQQLSGESGKIYLFYSLGFPGTTSAQRLKYVTSTDGGATWGSPTQLWFIANKSCYWAISSDDTSRIDFACSTGHVLNSQTADLYHFYYDGAWKKTDGTSMGSPSFGTADATKVYDGTTNGNIRVPYAISMSGPTIVWAACQVSNPLTTAENYWYATYTGGSWAVHTITTAGTIDLNHEVEGGIMIDPGDKNHVLLSKSGEILSYRTANSGTTWSNDATLTTDGAYGPNIRPFAPHNADATLLSVFLYGQDTGEASLTIGTQIRGYP